MHLQLQKPPSCMNRRIPFGGRPTFLPFWHLKTTCIRAQSRSLLQCSHVFGDGAVIVHLFMDGLDATRKFAATCHASLKDFQQGWRAEAAVWSPRLVHCYALNLSVGSSRVSHGTKWQQLWLWSAQCASVVRGHEGESPEAAKLCLGGAGRDPREDALS